MSNPAQFRFSIDRGGTFTDIYAEVPGAPGYRVVKLLSSDPANYPDAPREGIRRIMAEILNQHIPADDIPAERIEWIRMGTTIATNALLERRGARTALLISRGFRNLLKIGSQNRAEIFDLEINRPPPLYERICEIDERIRIVTPDSPPPGRETRQGIGGETIEILTPPDPQGISAILTELKAWGIESLAVVLMHSYTFPDHEQLIGDLARQAGFKQVSLSSEISSRPRIVPRGNTTVVDAYLTPHINDYIRGFQAGFRDRLAGTRLLFMRSDGGLTTPRRFSGSRAILSGPAGGVIGYAAGIYPKEKKPIIGFDMGGTSTDVSRYAGRLEITHEAEIAGATIQVPQLDIQTVAAGGGSRLFFRHGLFEVGPESAGAHPGPCCYRKDGHLTVTDANLVLGRLHPDFFPKIFGENGDQPLDISASRRAFEELGSTINRSRRKNGRGALSVEEIAEGFIRVANEVMVRPMREISVARGYDIREHVLACFGGAGGQHACAIAGILGISRIRLHRFAGILSACGLGLADVVEEISEPCCGSYQAAKNKLRTRLELLAAKAEKLLREQGIDPEQISLESYLNLRYQGTDTALMVETLPGRDCSEDFIAAHKREFGFTLPGREIMLDNLRVRAVGRSPHIQSPEMPEGSGPPRPTDHTECYFRQGWRKSPIYRFEDLGADTKLFGPALIIHQTSTILLEPNCSAAIEQSGDIIIALDDSAAPPAAAHDPAQLAVFSNLFMSLAEQMGRTLQKTAISTNIKERLDFSCALFDSSGGLVANAPHQPVHLGAMGEAVKQQIKRYGEDLRPGDVLITNHPAGGGSHLPDITVITPMFMAARPVVFLANRGHHADIGGITPGSMPPFSKQLSEEGICLEGLKLVKEGVFQEDEIRRLLLPKADNKTGPGPVRAIEDNISDLKAQIAANHRGVELFREICRQHSLPTVLHCMAAIQENAEQAVRDMLKALAGGPKVLEAEDLMDDGSPIRVKITIDRDRGSAIFDFSGSGPEVPGNCNAPRAVTTSAIIYVLRCLIKEDIPLNQGCLAPVSIILPPTSLLSPSETAAVVGGNVLTSQRIVDVLLKAFGAAAASQGCMNNFTFGNSDFGYYETIGGGAGAGPGWNGQSGVHTHMTNTRITDPEILEKYYPVILRRFDLRPDSGGTGLWTGGDGLVREIEFTAPLTAAILSERRVYPPYGLAGGKPGKTGRNLLHKNNGEIIDVGGKAQLRVEPGDRLEIRTPGGGGYGRPTTGSSGGHSTNAF